ncbi:B12-binding domain-containing radical SAM protein [Magnetospirillum gryphiswaldense]|uniref:Fe-S oxidoreductase n=1 Tax=Magnetospirillum gryphiswaldense TaxID=55518 RepID=A4U178_9PROT|nr:cobalamin-dependent protein [Magnetospirillum gryphiswaldense]AVM75584.1 B12 binding domain protein [Magnetospirillum gryphiswaldense MSR-1]AVM79487.1 B12 binding domain protein [Magnetospirillum gryphiswaldense]CAM76635.1 Fe-S oxidoreductase [Magnetospirillum gryphiswaldense MSR-1]
MAKVLLINPVVREEDVPRHVPYGLALLAAIALENHHLVQVYDANAWRLGEGVLRDVLAADDWQVIALGGMTTTYGSIKRIVHVAREVCPSACIVLGGGILTSLPQDMMRLMPEVDVGCIGEGFVTFPEILAHVDRIAAGGAAEWVKVAGTISRNDDGQLVLSPQRDLIHDLDVLPYPAFDLFPLEEVYFKNSEMMFSAEGMMAQRRLDINASYGCSMICRYCYHLGIAGDMRYEQDESGNIDIVFDVPGKYTRVTRYHSPEYIVKFAKYLVDKYNIDYVLFLDENLMTMDQYSGRTWLKEICRLWHEYGLAPQYTRDDAGNVVSWTGIHWSGTSHATLCTLEILKTMREAGCAHLVYGYESFAPHVLKTVGKGSTPKTNIRSFFWTLEAGIRPVPNQIIGFPAEDFESIRANMRAWDDLGVLVKPHFATPYPGSEWFTVYREQIVAQYGGDLEAFILDLGDASKISAVISHNFNAVELIGLREMMLNRDTKRIDEYERIWRKNHDISDGAPSTLFRVQK